MVNGYSREQAFAPLNRGRWQRLHRGPTWVPSFRSAQHESWLILAPGRGAGNDRPTLGVWPKLCHVVSSTEEASITYWGRLFFAVPSRSAISAATFSFDDASHKRSTLLRPPLAKV